MQKEINFEGAVDAVRKWDDLYQDRFYEKFPKILCQETHYDLLGLQQHEEEGFAADLEEEEFKEDITPGTHESLRSQLATLSSIAGREAAATQNITIYNDTMQLWQEAEGTTQLLHYLESYAEKRSEWNERERPENEVLPLQRPKLEYGETGEYVEDILGKLVIDTIYEI